MAQEMDCMCPQFHYVVDIVAQVDNMAYLVVKLISHHVVYMVQLD